MQLLDQIPSYDTHKIAVLYVGEGQVRVLGARAQPDGPPWLGLGSGPGPSSTTELSHCVSCQSIKCSWGPVQAAVRVPGMRRE